MNRPQLSLGGRYRFALISRTLCEFGMTHLVPLALPHGRANSMNGIERRVRRTR